MTFGASATLSAVAALAVVLALIWMGARAARLIGVAPRPTGTRILALRDALSLDARRRLLVIRCGARDLVLLVGGPQDLLLGWLDPPDKGGGNTAS
jgi:flagellar protein FliO/FliZ